MGWIRIESKDNIIPTGNGADFHSVLRHEIVCRTYYQKEDKQMNASTVCAASGMEMTWHKINWAECHRQVRRLQARIVKATQEGRWNKVKALQWLLTHSWNGRVIAVKRVTENQGKKTPGVDKATWSTPEAKLQAVLSLIPKTTKKIHYIVGSTLIFSKASETNSIAVKEAKNSFDFDWNR